MLLDADQQRVTQLGTAHLRTPRFPKKMRSRRAGSRAIPARPGQGRSGGSQPGSARRRRQSAATHRSHGCRSTTRRSKRGPRRRPPLRSTRTAASGLVGADSAVGCNCAAETQQLDAAAGQRRAESASPELATRNACGKPREHQGRHRRARRITPRAPSIGPPRRGSRPHGSAQPRRRRDAAESDQAHRGETKKY